MAQQVASRLPLQLDPAQQARLVKRHTSTMVAYEYYERRVQLDQHGAGIEAKPQMEATFALFNKHAAEQPLAAAAPTPPKPCKLSMRDMLTRGRLQAER
jgi:hypothetical protein